MSSQEQTQQDLDHPSNGVLSADAAAAIGFEDESKKDKKKKKKKKKKAEEKERRELLEKMDAEHPRLDGTPLKEQEKAIVEALEVPATPVRLQPWLRQASGTLDTHRLLTAHKASFLIGINCVMLSIAAHSIYRGLAPGALQWALIPLALTNVLSLGFAILSAQVQKGPTALDELWAMPADEYEPALVSMLQNRQRAYAALSSDLHLLGADLGKRQLHLRTAYNVLLGGVALSAGLFAVCALIGTGS